MQISFCCCQDYARNWEMRCVFQAHTSSFLVRCQACKFYVLEAEVSSIPESSGFSISDGLLCKLNAS